MSKCILVMAGGTGGHVFPGIAVADYLAEQGWRVHWLGTSARMEAQVVPQAGYEISFIDVEGVRGNGLLRLLMAPLKLINALRQALAVLQQVQPDVVLGMGGYASGPGGIAAWLKRIPLILHEQNAVPGLTNKLLAPLAQHILTGFSSTFAGYSKAQWVGNPVRLAFKPQHKSRVQSDKPKVLVVGGSLGAQILNETLPKVVAEQSPSLAVWHQCGAGRQQEVASLYAEAGLQDSVRVDDFVEDMATAYQWADLVICRAGALTVSEIAMVGVAAVFVPLPHAVDDHQTKNAQTLVKAKAAKIVAQSPRFSSELSSTIAALIQDPQQLQNMAKAAREIAKPRATIEVANVCAIAAGAKALI
ncbi:undecaprenyldiphospho-muramoylpentapeptide beta-N-acetylglucosaminyltransferase [Alteromonadaceae bacterium BrNp21-10]|nr:undecaprenyldiphospho-muramoylpentapeptide beta-N-acetylglucosaminyltransferase [Alteromonadaceae bacterium BrNp21-10]